MSRTVASSRAARAAATIALCAVIVVVPGGAVFAVEAGSEAPAVEGQEESGSRSIEDIGTQNDVSKQYLPEESELPAFQRFLYVPLFIVGIIVILLLLFRNLQWQPRFAEERRSKRRR